MVIVSNTLDDKRIQKLVFKMEKTLKNIVCRTFILCAMIVAITGCSSYEYPSTLKVGEPLISFTGQSLEGESISIPEDFSGQYTLLLFGYVQDAQFDIDRWLIGLDMTATPVKVYEIPTIKGMFPRMFKTTIDNGMRKGIPKELWKGVITVYQQGDKVQRFTGNQNPNNARVVLLDEQSKVVYFYDRGFSVTALNSVRELLPVN